MKTKLVLALGLAVFAALASAQGRGGGGMMMGRGGGSTFLLQRPDVQADLKLTSDQKSKLDALQAKMRDAMQGMRGNAGQGGDRQAMMQEFAKMRQENDKAVKEILTPQQAKRLDELDIQIAGNGVLVRPEIQEKLGLSDDQKKQIADLQQRMFDTMRETMDRVQNQEIDREEAQAETQNLRKKNEEAMGAVLTAEQKAKLKELGGAPFKMDPNWRPQNRFGGGGGN
ncbi:MAG: hypothetical protein KF733_03215 [Fimbriimonadaceae bacterium]|nr:MAG: hypothetical protein KF733_03215 [Fimbriimonadaceae bacterium]